MTIRLDPELKVQFDSLCNEFGMSTNTAFTIFARTVVRRRMIPFAIEAPTKEDVISKGKVAFDEIRTRVGKGEIPSFTMDEIDEEIRRTREGK